MTIIGNSFVRQEILEDAVKILSLELSLVLENGACAEEDGENAEKMPVKEILILSIVKDFFCGRPILMNPT